MMRVFRLLVWFVLGFCASAIPLLAYAETIPAESSFPTVQSIWICGGAAPTYSSCDAACIATWPGDGHHCDGSTCKRSSGLVQGVCNQTCPAGSALSGGTCVSSTSSYSCAPNQNWTLVGSNCTRPDCSAGQIRDPATGLCINDCNGANAKALNGTWVTGVGSSPSSGSLCSGGCFYGASTCGSWSADGVTKFVCKTTAATGANCSGQGISQALAGEAACAEKGQGTGTINGITVCAGTFDSTKTEGTKTTTPPGGGASTTKNETTTCTGGKCTTTTTETVSGGGGTTTGTVEQDQGSYCRENPLHPACKSEEKNYCDENPEVAGCKELGDPGTETDLTSEAKGVSSISVVSVSSNASCPADIQLPKGMKFEWAPICQWAEALRPIVLALAWLAAGIIVLGGSF